MRLSSFVTVLAGLVVASVPAAAQSIYGPGGLFLNPTADFAPKGQLSPAALYIPTNEPDRKTSLYSLGADYAISDKVEGGITYIKLAPGGDQPHGSFGGSLKFKLRQGRGWDPTLAAGGSYLGGGSLNARTAFFAAKFAPDFAPPKHPVFLHAGLLYADQLWGAKRKDLVPYVGATVELTRGVTAFGEWRERMKAYDPSPGDIRAPQAFGVILAPSEDYKLVLAYANNGQSTDDKFSVGVGFTLGSRRTTGGAR